MKPVAVKNFERADIATVTALGELGVATVHEAQGRSGLMQAYLRPVWRGARIAGSAITVLCHPNDNWMIHVAMEVAKPGDVLVVACSSENTNGAIGDLIATSLMARGVKGVVLDMGCRDVLELEQMKFPLWSRAISAQGTIKGTLGSVNFPVTCAGALVQPGDIVVADDDGVVVVPRQDAARVIKAAEEREKKEAVNRERLKKGELTVDIYDMRKALAEKGLKYIDGPLE